MSANPYGRPHAVWRGDNFVHMVTKPNDEPGLPVKKAVGFPAGSTTKQATYTGHLAEDGVKRAGEGEMWFPPFEAPTVITGTFVNNALAGKANVSYPKDVAIESTFGTELITATGEETTKFVHDSVLSIPVPKPEGAAEEDPAPKPVKYDRSGKFFFQDPDPEEEEGAGA